MEMQNFIQQSGRFWLSPTVLWGLFIINFAGSIYGFYWYADQLAITNWYWLIFVPDSPMASAFFTFVLGMYLLNKKKPLLEAFAAITLFKYGIWAVAMIVWGGMLDWRPFMEALTWQHWMLICSHLGMALQAVIYAPWYAFGWREISIVAAWTLLNDALDYTMEIHPWVAAELEPYHWQLAGFTVLLSGVSLLLFATLMLLRRRMLVK
jgi:uncharacterized membrane protein YpjA